MYRYCAKSLLLLNLLDSPLVTIKTCSDMVTMVTMIYKIFKIKHRTIPDPIAATSSTPP